MSTAKGSRKVAVVGSGLIGRSWAMLFAGAGYSVSMYDTNPDQLKVAVDDIKQQLHHLKEQGLLRGQLTIDEQMKLLTTTSDLKTAMHNAIYVQESVWENLEAKTAVFKEMDAVATKGQILASSTSTIPPSKFTSGLAHKEYCVVAHPCNPPFYCPLIELVPNQWTLPEVMQKSEEIMKEIGQVPVKLKKEIVGFGLNRIQYALLAECWRLVQDDVMEVEDIDKIFKDGLGLRYAFFGPLEITHINAPGGVADYCGRYNRGYLNCIESMGPAPSWEGDLLEKVRKPLEAQVPVDQVQKRSAWRDVRLAALAKLKKDLNEKTGP
jgi:L-gulonate 3-dehydrogenase